MELKEQRRPKINFDVMTEEELDVHINRMLEREHRENGIQNYEMAEHKLKFELSQGLITEKEFEMFIEGEKKFWSKDGC